MFWISLLFLCLPLITAGQFTTGGTLRSEAGNITLTFNGVSPFYSSETYSSGVNIVFTDVMYTNGNLEVTTTTPIILNPNQSIDSSNFPSLSAQYDASKNISTTINSSLYNATVIISNVSHAPTGMRLVTDGFNFSYNYSAGEFSFDAINNKLLVTLYNLKAINNYLILDTVVPYFITVPADAHVSFPDTFFSAQFQASDTYNFNYWAINDSRFTITQDGLLTPNAVLQVGTYNINVSIFDTYNNSAATVYHVFVGNEENILNLDIYPSINVVNGTTTTAQGSSCPAQLTCVLYRNGVNVTNPDIQTLGAGVYAYIYNTSGNVNYSARSVSKTLTVTSSPATTVIVPNLDKLTIGINGLQYPKSLGTYKINSNVTLTQTCDDGYNFCESCKITSVKSPANDTFILTNVAMNWTGQQFEYILKDTKFTKAGDYLVNGYCTSGNRLAVWNYYLTGSYTGENSDLNGDIWKVALVIILLIIAGIMAFSANSFDNSQWILKSGLFIGALLISLISVALGVTFAATSESRSLMITALIIIIVTVIVTITALIIYYFKAIIKAIQQAKQEKDSDLGI